MPAAPFSVWKARKAPSRRSRSSGLLLEREQVVVALGHELAALDQELLDELVHAGNPHMMETCWTSASWATGFTR